jgi:hypothetical protein
MTSGERDELTALVTFGDAPAAASDSVDSAPAVSRRRRVRPWHVVVIVLAGFVLLAWLVVPVIPLLIAPSQIQVCDSTFTSSANLSSLEPVQGLGRLGQTHAFGVVPMAIWGSCASGGPQREVYVQLNNRTVVTYYDVRQG